MKPSLYFVPFSLPLYLLSGLTAQVQAQSIYAEAGIWHEVLISLVQLRQTEPNNFKARLDWKQFFKSVGLSAIALTQYIAQSATKM